MRTLLTSEGFTPPFCRRADKLDPMRYRYYICDVFTDTRFGGNQLAALPEANGLSDEQMQRIAREFNFSETAFVFPAEAGHTSKVHIFTPTREVPSAGHPNIGTAFALAAANEFGQFDTPIIDSAGFSSPEAFIGFRR